MSKKLFFVFAFVIFAFLFFNIKYYEFEVSEKDMDSSLIGLTIDGSSTTNFPDRDSGYAIESILCDKDATGVWDYENWSLRLRNVTQSRTKCQVNFVSKYHENILNGTDPVLKDELIPVIIENDGTVHKASLGWEWYKYEEQKWANAVILNDEYEKYYDGDIIPEEAIESYFVWIPRYKYQIFNAGNYTGKDGVSTDYGLTKVIHVSFETKDVAKSTGSTVGSWLTHPAFTSFETNGMWVGKFETGYKGATSTEGAQQNPNNGMNGTPDKVIIKPNVYSWREIQVANAYWTSYNYQRDYNSHMMKNTEWGAVAYLQHSKYGSGVYAGTSESSKASVRINNNASFMTGYAAIHAPTCGFTNTNEECNKYETINTLGVDGTYTVNYFNSLSQVASTTGNYSGIYDMSGGAWEYVMGVMLNSTNSVPCSGRDSGNHSGFNGPYCDIGQTESLKSGVSNIPTDTRYYDTYAYSTDDEHYYRRILGDATGEMGPFTDRTYGSPVRQVGSWHDDEAWFVWSWYPWFYRGARFDHGSNGGVLAFGNMYGSSLLGRSFRIVLSV